jgi:endopolyphosphatase
LTDLSLPRIWSDFIPEDQQHNFARGGYYALDAIPDSLILISLNTLYFYDSNKAVDGCPPYKGFSADIDPGTEQLLWLEQQLIIARERGSQVWLTGHVPPTRANWYEGCYLTYGDLMLSFHDTIVGYAHPHPGVLQHTDEEIVGTCSDI